MTVTIVSCFYIVNSKYPINKYLKWIDNFMNFNFNRVIFCNENSYKIFEKYGKNNNTIFKILDINDFETSKYDWNNDILQDVAIPYHNHTIDLYKIWNEKIYFVKKTIEINPFNSKYFMWLDIGSFRSKYHNIMKNFDKFPNETKFIDNKIILAQIYPFTDVVTNNIQQIDSRFTGQHFLGGLFAGDSETLLKFENKFTELLKIFKDKNIFAGVDQTFYNYIALQNPDLVHIIDANKIHPTYNPWFCFHYYFS
jgi:hypothetical protein